MLKENFPIEKSSRNKWAEIRHLPPFDEIDNWLSLSKFDNLLDADALNQLKKNAASELLKTFVCQDEMADIDDYYETIIYKNNQIPTRPESWHDLYNGLVWLQYPKTKALLNAWHVQDISKHGLTPRTRRRNGITHFDECGVILASSDETVTCSLSDHQWLEGLHQNRQAWGTSIKAFVFGHANYEMLMSPFLGLTGKWLRVAVGPGFFDLKFAHQIAELDQSLCLSLEKEQNFTGPLQLRPLPLLGIPHWWAQNNDSFFYANQNYFRPKRSKAAPTALK